MLRPSNKECPREVRRSTTRRFLWYQRVRFLTMITCYVILKTCQWKLAKIQDWKYLYSQSNLHGNRHPICWEMKWYFKMIYDNIHFMSVTVNKLASTRAIVRKRQKWYRIQKLQDIKHIKNLDMKYKWLDYVILPHPYTIRPYLW